MNMLSDSVIHSNQEIFFPMCGSFDLDLAQDRFQKIDLINIPQLSVTNARELLPYIRKVFSPLKISPHYDFGKHELFDFQQIHGTTLSIADSICGSNIASSLHKNFSSSFATKNRYQSSIHSLIIAGLNLPYFLSVVLPWAISNKINRIAFVETNIENIALSCFVLDWSIVRSSLKKAGISSTFFFDSDLTNCVSSSVQWFSNQSFYAGINFYLFVDRVSNQHMNQVFSLVNDKSAYGSIIGKGFVEDNFNLANNTFKSISQATSYVTSLNSCDQFHILLVASGPSLDNSYHEIRELNARDDVILVAAGSSVTSLIEEDILPDYVVLVERNESVYLKHKNESKYHKSFSNINLIAATSVDPRIHQYYNSTSLFCRSSNIFSTFFPLSCILPHTHPTSLNAALSFCISVCPKSISMFGCDFGSESKRYSRQSNAHGLGSYKFSMAIRGINGTMFSNDQLFRSKTYVDELIDTSDLGGIHIFNRGPAKLHSYIQNVSSQYLHTWLSVHRSSSLKSGFFPFSTFSPQFKLLAFDFAPMASFLSSYDLESDTDICFATMLYLALRSRFSRSKEFRFVNPLFITSILYLSAFHDSELALTNSDICSSKRFRAVVVETFSDIISECSSVVQSIFTYE